MIQTDETGINNHTYVNLQLADLLTLNLKPFERLSINVDTNYPFHIQKPSNDFLQANQVAFKYIWAGQVVHHLCHQI